MYKIGICDDGRNVCASIENMLLQYAGKRAVQTEVLVWYTGEMLRDYLEEGNHLDILFLDIELFRMTGIDVGHYIREHLDDMGMQIVYISGKTSYARLLFRTQPLDFLVKPISGEQMDDVMDAALRILQRKKEHFEFQRGKEHYYIPMGDILYLESRGRKIRITTPKASFEFYGRLKEAAKALTEDFIVIHQSYIVNREHVFRYTYETVELTDGTVLTISPANRKAVRERILREK